jgi:hypothetical protein
VIAGTALTLGAILAGLTDPDAIGRLVVDDRLIAFDGWAVSSQAANWEPAPDGLSVTVQPETRAYFISPYSLTSTGTVEISARQIQGASDAIAGVWWGSEQSWTAAAISSDGYFGMPSMHGDEYDMTLDWHRFPWLLPQGESNRIRIDFSPDGQVRVRLNEEIAAVVPWEGGSLIKLGLYVETTRHGGSVTNFERLRLWSR